MPAYFVGRLHTCLKLSSGRRPTHNRAADKRPPISEMKRSSKRMSPKFVMLLAPLLTSRGSLGLRGRVFIVHLQPIHKTKFHD